MTGKDWKTTREAMFEPGAVIECVANTYRPVLDGTTRTVTVAGPTRVSGEMDGKPFDMRMPKRVSEIELLPDGSIRYPLERDNHTVTLRRIA